MLQRIKVYWLQPFDEHSERDASMKALACLLVFTLAGNASGCVPSTSILGIQTHQRSCDMSIVEHSLMTICTGAVMIGDVAFPSEQAEQQDGHRHDVQDE